MKERMLKKICMDEKDPSTSGRECNEQSNETSGLQGGIDSKVMAMPYKQDNALYLPTSALERYEC
jgi:hypothetical protein